MTKVTLHVDGLNFEFPEGWLVEKYDDWQFYRCQFSKQKNEIKAVDILALSPENCAYFIEVKDYRHPDTKPIKPSELPQKIAGKVLDTLSALLPAKLRARKAEEQQFAKKILVCKNLKVIAHLELVKHRPPLIDPADIKDKLARLLRAVDAHPKVVSMKTLSKVPWTVTAATKP
jgi:hypothetical protein